MSKCCTVFIRLNTFAWSCIADCQLTNSTLRHTKGHLGRCLVLSKYFINTIRSVIFSKDQNYLNYCRNIQQNIQTLNGLNYKAARLYKALTDNFHCSLKCHWTRDHRFTKQHNCNISNAQVGKRKKQTNRIIQKRFCFIYLRQGLQISHCNSLPLHRRTNVG